MRLDEIQPDDAAKQRVHRLKHNAEKVDDKAKQLKAQADTVAARQDMQKSLEKLAQVQQSATKSNIEPHH